MDYFVNIEHAPFYQWQAELLIESFKHHELDESLVVGLSLTNVEPRLEFCRNLYTHPRTSGLTNMGEVRGFDRLANLYSMANLLQTGNLKQPFLLIEPDSVLYSPVKMPVRDIPQIIFQVDPFFTKELVEENIPNYNKHKSTEDWVPLGNVMFFDKLPQEFFNRVIFLTEMLAFEQAKAGKEIWKRTDRAAWAIAITELVGRSVIEGKYTLEMSLADHEFQHNFVNYGRSPTPQFNKHLFQYAPPTCLSLGGDPLEVLAGLYEHLGTTSTQYVSGLARMCLDARK